MNSTKEIKELRYRAGYVGGPTMATDKCPNIKVYVVDRNIERINKWNNNELSELPIYEPGLDKIIQNAEEKFSFSSDIEEIKH